MRKTWLALATLGTTGLLACSGGNSGQSVALDGDDSAASGSGGMGSDGSGGSSSAGGGTNFPSTIAPGTTAPQNVNFIPTFPGAGTSPGAGEPLAGGEVCDAIAGETVRATRDVTRCFFGPESETVPAATIEQVLECAEGTDVVHMRVTFDPGFVDNTYGAGSIGWPEKRGHRFSDLVKSDHAELVLIDGDGEVAMQFKMDYITEDESAPSGYGTLGVLGGDGSVAIGSADHVVKVETSLDRNLNERGYGSYLVDSPLTDENFSPNADAPEWDFRMVYDVWVDLEAFGDAGFSGAFIEYVHASPAKKPEDTIEVVPGECPPCQPTPDTTCGPQPPLDPPGTPGGGTGGTTGGGTGGMMDCGDLPDDQCPGGPFPPTGGTTGSGTGGSSNGGTGGSSNGGTGGSSSGGTGGSSNGGTGGSMDCGDLPDDQCPGGPIPPTGGTGTGGYDCGDLPDDQCGPGGPIPPPPEEPPPYCTRYPTDPACTLE